MVMAAGGIESAGAAGRGDKCCVSEVDPDARIPDPILRQVASFDANFRP